MASIEDQIGEIALAKSETPDGAGNIFHAEPWYWQYLPPAVVPVAAFALLFIASVGTITWLGWSPVVVFVLTAIFFVLFTLIGGTLLGVRRARSRAQRDSVDWGGFIVFWAIVSIILVILYAITFSILFGFPHELRHILDPSIRNQSVEATLIDSQNNPIRDTFKISYRLPSAGELPAEGVNGSATIRGLPANLGSLEITEVSCVGWKTKEKLPIRATITTGRIAVVMIEDRLPPRKEEEYPAVSDELLPSADEVMKPSAFQPQEVTFHYENRTGEDVELLMFNIWNRYFGKKPGQASANWATLPIKAGAAHWTERFRDGTGWFRFYIRDSQGKIHPMRTECLFKSKNPRLVVQKDKQGFTIDLSHN